MDRQLFENEFDDMGLSISDDILDECVIASHTNKISASDFVGSWIAHCASSQFDPNDLNKEAINKLIKSFKKDDEYSINDNKYVEKKSCDVKSDLNESSLLQSIDSPSSLKSKRGTSITKIENEISVSDIIVGNDKNNKEKVCSSAGDIACEFGRGNVDDSDSSAQVETVCFSKQDLWENLVYGHVSYKKLDDHIEDLVNDIVKNNNLKYVTPLSELYSASDSTEITISGTLKLVKKDLFLCSSYGYIKLDLSEAEQPVKPLFANQILVITGTNPDTKVFKVRKLYCNAALPLSKNVPTFSNGNMNLIVAAGPFFSESSPHGTSLKSLVQETIKLEASFLVLLGPIFEGDFGTQLNKTSSENLQKCYDDVLEAILQPLFSNSTTQHTKLVVLSSWKDACSYAFYPTPPNRESRLLTLYPNNVFMVSDPSVFSANDVIIANNASDALMGLHVSAINQVQEEMFTKLCKQIIWQRCLHPSYTANPTVPVDQLQWLEHCTLNQHTPHIILMSSQLRTFIRVVEGCLFINVGSLVKHNSQNQAVTGTYGKIRIAPSKNGNWSPQNNIFAEVIHI